MTMYRFLLFCFLFLSSYHFKQPRQEIGASQPGLGSMFILRFSFFMGGLWELGGIGAVFLWNDGSF